MSDFFFDRFIDETRYTLITQPHVNRFNEIFSEPEK